MKKSLMLITLICLSAICSSLYAQQAPPPGAGDKDLGDKNIKTRSIELERVDRDTKQGGKPAENSLAAATPEDNLAAKYGEIKTYYEQMQLSQDGVIKTYQSGGKIDYTQISEFATEINQSAARLKLNLFPAPIDEKPENKDGSTAKTSKSVRDLIVELDNAIGDFVKSPMFQNLRTIDAETSVRAQTDLDKIIEASALLGTEAGKKSVK